MLQSAVTGRSGPEDVNHVDERTARIGSPFFCDRARLLVRADRPDCCEGRSTRLTRPGRDGISVARKEAAGRKLRWGPEGRAGRLRLIGPRVWMGGVCVSGSPRRGVPSLSGGDVAVGYPEDDRLDRRLKRVNAEIADGCALELACSPGEPSRDHGRRRRGPEEGLVLLGILSSGVVAVVPVMPARTARRRLLSLSDSIAECAMLLGLGTGLYGLSVRPGD